MDDLREKVIKGLEEFERDLKPYAGNHADWGKVDDALSLLKAQEPKTVKERLVVGGHLMGKCPRCSKILTIQDHPGACGFCGQAVRWE